MAVPPLHCLALHRLLACARGGVVGMSFSGLILIWLLWWYKNWEYFRGFAVVPYGLVLSVPGENYYLTRRNLVHTRIENTRKIKLHLTKTMYNSRCLTSAFYRRQYIIKLSQASLAEAGYAVAPVYAYHAVTTQWLGCFYFIFQLKRLSVGAIFLLWGRTCSRVFHDSDGVAGPSWTSCSSVLSSYSNRNRVSHAQASLT